MAAESDAGTRERAGQQRDRGITSLYNSGDYSDITVKCSQREWKLHRTILCIQSNYFRKACSKHFLEGTRGIIELKDEDPALCDIMLNFLYSFSYDLMDSQYANNELTGHAHIYAMADRYDIAVLKDTAIANFQYTLQTQRSSEMIIDDSLIAIDVIYTTTLSTDRGLRDCLTPKIQSRKGDLVNHASFVALVKTLADGDFAMDVVKALNEMSPQTAKSNHKCVMCNYNWHTSEWKCPRCHYPN